MASIAVDIDGVLGDYAGRFAFISNLYWGTSISPDNYSDDWRSLWNVDAATARCRAERFLSADFLTSIQPMPGAREALAGLVPRVDIHIVTSRPMSAKDATEEWLLKNFRENFWRSINFLGAWSDTRTGISARSVTKGSVCQKLGAKALIDDQYRQVESAVKLGLLGVWLHAGTNHCRLASSDSLYEEYCGWPCLGRSWNL